MWKRITTFLVSAWYISACLGPEQKGSAESTSFDDLRWQARKRPCNAHLRGLHVVSDAIIWASGTEGTVIRSVDSGLSWKVMRIPGAENLDFRDIEAFGEDHAVVLSAGNGVSIYTTEDGGNRWELRYHDGREAIFYDGFDFKDGYGVAYGDPLFHDHKAEYGFMPIRSLDSGRSWSLIPRCAFPTIRRNEAGFAASGTGIQCFGDEVKVALSGGPTARMFLSSDSGRTWEAFDTPLRSAIDAGIFSMYFWDNSNGVIAGGSYIDSTRADSNCAYTSDGGRTWRLVTQKPLSGYRSCVAGSENGGLLIATGRSGTDVSTDWGRSWKRMDDQGYFSCDFGIHSAWAVGRGGRIACMKW